MSNLMPEVVNDIPQEECQAPTIDVDNGDNVHQ